MQLGISSYTFPWAIGIEGHKPTTPLTSFNLVDYAFENKIYFLQIGDNLPLHLLADDELYLLKQDADEKKIKLQVGTRGLKQEHILHYLSIAKKLDSSFLRIVTDDKNFEPSIAEIIETIKSLLPYLKQANVCLAIENHDRFTAEILKTIIEQTDPSIVGICLDTANSFGAGESIKEVTQLLSPYVINLHIKDFIITRVAHKMGFTIQGCPAGDGSLNIPWLINEFLKNSRCAVATLEVWSNPDQNIEKTLQKEKAWVEKSIYYLKNKLA
jgi:3-oxoisoapionate decarboxylase